MRAVFLLPFFLLWDCSLSESTFLRSGSAAHREASKRLQSEANRLAKALRWTFGDDPNLVSLARTRLAREADELVDLDGAPLVSSYARHAPPSVLVLGTGAWPESGGLFSPEMEEQGPDENEDESFSSQTQESIIRHDGKGRTIRRTRRCKNGECIERTEVGVAPVGSLHGHRPQRFEGPSAAKASLSDEEPASPDSLSQAVRSMARSMHSIEQSLGHSGLEDLLDGLFRHNVTRTDKENEAETVPGEGLAEGMFNHRAQGNETESAHMESESESSSTEVVVDNGKVTRRTQRCKNGHCETKVEESSEEGDKPEVRNQTGAKRGSTVPF